MIRVTDEIQIDERELHETFIRASGPGGQNVNKVSTAVQLRFNVLASPGLTPYVKGRLMRLAGARATSRGEVLIEADRHRTREQNRADALARLVALIRKAAHRPKARRKTQPSRAAKQRRLQAKKARGEVKRSRRPVKGNDAE